MRPFLLVALLTTASSASAQGTTRQVIDRPQGATTPLADVVRYEADRLGLPDLRNGPAPGADAELRLWHGFGLTGLALVVLRREAGTWRAFGLYPVRTSTTIPLQPDTATPATGTRWASAVAAGLYDLPPSPQRPPSDLIVDDGFGAVIEWWQGNRYRITGADNPDAHCSPDDRRLISVVEALLGHAWPTSHHRCPA